MKESKEVRFQAGPKGTVDLVAERAAGRIKAVGDAFQGLQKICNLHYSERDKRYWELMANTFFTWPLDDVRCLAREIDKKIFISPQKMDYLLNLILSSSLAKVEGKALFGPEELEILTK